MASDTGHTTIEYYFYLEFDNNTISNYDPSYAFVKPYQYMPGYIESAEDVTELNLQSVYTTSDDASVRSLITGSEKSFGVHEDGIYERR